MDFHSASETKKHQELSSSSDADKAEKNAKDKSVVSWWWLSVPLFIILMMLLKSIYMHGTTLITNIHELASIKVL
jgi:hypothetical protein